MNWIIAANRGMVALHIGLYASAVQMFHASIHLSRYSTEMIEMKSNPTQGVYTEGMLQGLLALAYIGLGQHEKAREANILACKQDR